MLFLSLQLLSIIVLSLLPSCNNPKVQFVWRSANGVAHSIARATPALAGSTTFNYYAASCISAIIMNEMQ